MTTGIESPISGAKTRALHVPAWRPTRTARYALRRLAVLPLGAFVVASLAFVVVNVLPGHPERVIAGDLASPAQVAEVRHRLGLDQALGPRYLHFLGGLIRGDLGTSYYSQTSVMHEIAVYLPSTLELAVLALLFATILGLLMGGVGAYFLKRLPDRGVSAYISLAQSVPDFFLGLILIYTLFFVLHLAPAPVGQLGLFDTPPSRVTGAVLLDSLLEGKWALAWDALQHAFLPVIALGIFVSSFVAKISRAVLSESLKSDHVYFARALGLPERTVLLYALRAVRAPIVTYIGLMLATLAGGAAIVETVFSWNGAGQWAVQSILRLDLPAIQGFIVIIGLLTLVIFLMVDLLVLKLDPRVSYDRAE